jgi:Polysaccharide biosynthesis protein
VIAFIATLSLASVMGSQRALIIDSVVGRVSGAVPSYTMQPFRPRFCLDKSGELFSFSGWMLLKQRSVGRARPHLAHRHRAPASPRSAGASPVGSEIAYLSATELTAPINRGVPRLRANGGRSKDAER